MIEIEKIIKENALVDLQDDMSMSAEKMLRGNIVGVPMLVEGVFHRVGLASLIGSSDLGKSSLLRQLAIAVVSGRDFLTWKTDGLHRRVVYVSSEDDGYSVSALLKKQNKDFGLEPEDLEGLTFLFDTENLIMRLDYMLTNQKHDLIIIDAFSDIFSGQLYETSSVRGFLNQFSLLAQKHQCLIIFLHHTNKRSDSLTPSKHNSLGSQGFEAKMRLMIEVKKNGHDPQLRHFCIVKGNYLSQEIKEKSYDMMFSENMTFTPLSTRTSFDRINQKPQSQEVLDRNEEILQLREEGMKYREIATLFNISIGMVANIIKKNNT